MKSYVLLATLCAVVTVVCAQGTVAEYLLNVNLQKQILDLLQHVYQINPNDDVCNATAKSNYTPINEQDKSRFEIFRNNYRTSDFSSVQKFIVTDRYQNKVAIELYHFLTNDTNLNNLFDKLCWAKYNVHVEIFMYAFMGMLNKPGVKSAITVPPIYEINPFAFFNSRIIEKTAHYETNGFDGVPKVDGVYTVIIPGNYTGMYAKLNNESLLTYYTEDVGLNAWYYDYCTENAVLKVDSYIRFIKRILARYYMERLTNGLGEIPDFSWTNVFANGYDPDLLFYDGMLYPKRENFVTFYTTEHKAQIDNIIEIETKLKAYQRGKNEEEYYNLITNFLFSSYEILGHKHYPNAIQQYETALRDPLFYQFLKHFLFLVPHEKHYQPADIKLNGVKIESVEMSKLVTYFDEFDSDITNSIEVTRDYDKNSASSELVKYGRHAQYKGDGFVIKARQWRLNNVPINVTLHVDSNAVQNVSLITYIGPKYDELGNVLDVNQNKDNFFELDNYEYQLQVGKNMITRSSHNFTNLMKDEPNFYDIYKNTMLASVQKEKRMQKEYLNFPERLLLPKGKADGFAVQFFFIIVPYRSYSVYAGIFDREIVKSEWFTSNMYYFDANVYHRKGNEPL